MSGRWLRRDQLDREREQREQDRREKHLGHRFKIEMSDQIGDPTWWLELNGQRAVPVGLPGTTAAPGVMWTRRDDPNGTPRFAKLWETMVYDPATGDVRVEAA